MLSMMTISTQGSLLKGHLPAEHDDHEQAGGPLHGGVEEEAGVQGEG